MNGKKVKVGACILAGNMKTMVEFYRDILGFDTNLDGGNFAKFVTASDELSFFMYNRRAFAESINESYVSPKGINQTFEIALWLPHDNDVDAEYMCLSKMNIKFPTGEPKTFSFGIRNFYIADPEGNLLEIGSMNK